MQAIEDAAVFCLRWNVSFAENNASPKSYTSMETEVHSRPIQLLLCQCGFIIYYVSRPLK